MLQPVRTPLAVRALAPGCLWRGPLERHPSTGKPIRTLYLTFDDGPTPGVTDAVLSLLRAHNAKATFFCLGRQVDAYPDLARQIMANGHALGSHTYVHTSGWGTPLADYLADIERGDDALHRATGQRPVLFRPPYGRLPAALLGDFCRSRPVVMWSLCTWDFEPATAATDVVRNVRRHARPADIILLHDNERTADKVLAAVPALLLFAREQGYSLRALPPTPSSCFTHVP